MKIKNLEIFVACITLVLMAGFTLYIISLFKELPSEEELQNFTPVLSTKIVDRNEKLITELFTEKRTWVKFNDIPENLKLAVLAIEDHNFYHHWGINPKRIIKAIIDNIVKRKITVGGSTITQQLAKISFLSLKRDLKRKLKEFILALYLEHHFSKNEILEMYLNQVYFGHGAYGIQQAAQRYFSKNPNELTLSEAALLAGLIRSPMYYSPIKYYERSIARRNVVLKRMLELKYITKEEYEKAIAEKIRIFQYSTPSFVAPYFIDYIREELEKDFPPEILYNGGLTIKTTLDLELQKRAEEIYERYLSQLDKTVRSSETIQGALLAMEVKTGQVLAMIGGRDFKTTQFNRVTQALRQPGSAFKPIIFLAALEHGFKPNSIIEDTPLVFFNNGIDWELLSTTTDFTKIDYKKIEGKLKVKNYNEFISNLASLKKENKIWIPENYKNQYYGKVTLRRALELSLNSCAIRLIMEVGPNTVTDYARKLGITTPLTNTYSLALGASEVIPLELVSAYSVFANNGIKVKPYGIIEVRDRFGNILKSYYPKEDIVISQESTYIITNLLKGVVKHGTGRYALNLGKTCAGKTGTTNDCTDAWFIGYTPDIICGVWVGFDIKKSLGKDSTGGKIACPIWTEFMKFATKDLPDRDFEKPENIVEVEIDAENGLLATPYSKKTYLEAFIKGTEPKEYSSPTEKIIKEQEILQDTGF
jgi:penicillin-binding protein 1A